MDPQFLKHGDGCGPSHMAYNVTDHIFDRIGLYPLTGELSKQGIFGGVVCVCLCVSVRPLINSFVAAVDKSRRLCRRPMSMKVDNEG